MQAGLGPEYANLRSHGVYTNTVNAELIGDFLLWRSPRHRLGLYAEPTYSIDLRQDHAESLGSPPASSSASTAAPTLPANHNQRSR